METYVVDWLPEPETIIKRTKGAAAADVLLSPDPDLRQFHFQDTWKDSISLAWHHDGAGSYYYILFSGSSMAIKVCALRSSLSPDALARFQRQPTAPISPLATTLINEPEFRYQELSFLAWKEGDQPWQGLSFRVDNIPSDEMGQQRLEPVVTGPKSYYINAMSYHEVTLDPPALKEVFTLTPMTQDLVSRFSPKRQLSSCEADLRVIGYPIA